MRFVTKGQKQFKANLHSHSVLSDGKKTPEELVEMYREKGYSILAVTDHEYPADHTDLTTDDMLMITGYEAYIRPSKICRFNRFAPEIHLNLIARDPHNTGIVCYDPVCFKYMPLAKQVKAPHYGRIGRRKFTVPYINRFIRAANEHGYLVSLNHPCWSMQDTEDLKRLEGLWSLEIFNTASMKLSGYAENMPVYDSLLRYGKTKLYCHGSDDNHNTGPLDDPMSDSFGAWTMVICEELSYGSVIEALEKGNFYASTGPVINRLEFEDGKAYVECTDAKRITMHMTPKYSKTVYDREGKTIDSAVFDLPSDAPYVYFSIVDGNGGKAYTHAFELRTKKKK
ncbi:MAG: hypothetical protein IKN14_02665 [Clostridiales bacterium]|nr:hypothetical protein [Clostridiales bacterium]